MVSVRCKKVLVFSTGTFLLLFGAIVGALWGVIYEKMLRMELVLTNTSRSYKMWKDIPIPIYMEIFMFNWTNAAEIEAGKNVKPHFVEMGPYVFREYHHRVNITWNVNNTVTYQQNRTWYFQPDMSNGSLSDEVTNLNMIAATVAYQTRNRSWYFRILLNALMDSVHTKLVITKTVRELLFDGYEDELLDLIRKFTKMPVPFQRFGYFVQHNKSITADGIFSIWTGQDDLRKLGLMTEWNFQNHTGFFGQPCDKVQGSSGDLWPPLTGHSHVYIFASDLCYSLPLAASVDTEVHGLPGKIFVGDNQTLNVRPQCPCVGDCQPYGTLDASACRFGSPLFVSFPHFYLAHPSYLAPLQGLQPNISRHQFVLALQPETGMPLHVEARLQLNVMIKKWSLISIFKNVRQQMFIPTVWFAQRASLPSDLAAEVHTLVVMPAIGKGTLFGIAGIGAFILLVGALLSWRQGWGSNTRNEDTRPLISSDVAGNSYGSIQE